jgi:hypothetical protein
MTLRVAMAAGFLLAVGAWAIDPQPQQATATGQESIFLPNETFRVTGEALAYKLRRPNQTQFQQAGGTNLGVPSGTVVSTANRTVNLVLNDAIDVILQPNTEVSVNFFSRGITLGIVKGKLDCLIDRERWRDKYVHVVHGTLVAAATGTHFTYDVQGHHVEVDVYAGTVTIYVTHIGDSAPPPDGRAPGDMTLSIPTRVDFHRDGSMQISDVTHEDYVHIHNERGENITPGIHVRGGIVPLSARDGRGWRFRQVDQGEVEREARQQRLRDGEVRGTDPLDDPRATDWRVATRGRPVNEEQRLRLEAARERCAREMRLIFDSVSSGAAANEVGLEAQRNLALMDYFAIIAEICGVNPPPRGQRPRAEDYDCERIRRELIPPIRYVVEISSQDKNSEGMREALDASNLPPLGAKGLLVFLEGAVADNQISPVERRKLQEILDWMAVMVDAPDTPVPNL